MISRNQIVPQGFGLAIAHALFMLVVNTSRADTTPQTLPFSQNWTNTGLITTSNDWSGVPGIIGYRGDGGTTTTGVDPQTVVADLSGVVNVLANQNSPNTNTTGGLAEFEITNPVVAFQGSGTARAPNLVISLNTTGQTNINVSYNLRDIDGSTDNSVQPVALQYRVGSSGNYTNIPAGFVADASTGPSLATLVTPVSVTLPAPCNNQPLVQLRILTADAVGSDEWIGVDDISITGAGASQLLSINDVSQNETDSGATTFAFTVSLSLPAGAGGVTFDICTQDNTATVADGDYVSNCLTSQVIPQGSQTYQFNVTVNGDTKPEPNETFFVNVTNISNATGSDTQGLGTIVNDDVLQIHDIQGSGNTSPLAGQTVTTTGIVTGVRSNGFFIQTPDAGADADPNTSEGVFVFTGSPVPAGAAVGNAVRVTGTVQEFIPSSDPFSPAQTEISGSPVTTVQSTGNPLPAPRVITMAETQVNDLNNLEKYEGMRVQVNSLTVVAPTQGSIDEANATSTSNGVFYGVVTGVARPFREPGIQVPDPVPTPYPPGPGPANVPRFDFNPERLRVSSCSLAGSSCIDVPSGATLTNIIGPLDYGSRTYTIDVDPSSPPAVAGIVAFVAVPAPLASELTVSSFNMQRFFDTVDDPGVSDVVLTAIAFNNRLKKASLAIRNVLRMPDVIGVEEMENLTTLQAIADKVNADAGPGTTYQAFLVEGNDVGGIDVGFLVKTQANGLSRITVTSVTQYNKAETYIDPDSNSSALLNDRPPLVLRASVAQAGGGTYSFTVIANHLRSLSGVGSTTSAHTRVKRQKQAESLANLIHSFETVGDPKRVAPFDDNIVSVGDYNSFEFNDGYVDVVGTVLGTPAPADQVVQPSATISTGLTDLIQFAAAGQNYSYTFDGDAQALDHELANSSMLARFTRLAYGRMDADYPEAYRSDPNRPEKLSDHDPSVAYFDLTPAPTPTATPTPTPTPTATPSATAAQSLNISTRLRVETGDKVMIAGFIIQGNAQKPVLLRGMGPSLAAFGVTGVLLDPVLELRNSSSSIATNDNWKDSPQRSRFEGTPFQPSDDRESVVLGTLPAANYTALLTGKNNTTGVGIVEVYDRDQTVDAQLANISTRGFVQAGENVMIGGFILGGSANNTRIALRGVGPSLAQFGLNPVLADPTLELKNANGTTLVANDNWTDDPTSASLLTANGLGLGDTKEAGIFTSLPAGQFSAILAGKNGGIGIGLIEVYNLR